jgi:isopenicillin-N epimerase
LNGWSHHWSLDPEVDFLNHGSFGACPIAVLDFQQELRARLERQPVQFMVRELDGMANAARAALADFVGADPEGVAFVSNATGGVNTVLRSLAFEPGDELLVTDHEYNACRNALDFVAARSGARVVEVPIPFPLEGSDEVVTAILERVTGRTRLALIDSVTSPTGMVMPVEAIVAGLRERGVLSLIDGAHAPGMIPLALDALGADFFTGNCHKWLCTPKGAALLYVREEHRQTIRPLTISHGANAPTATRSRFRNEFDWMGTHDPTAYLCIPEAIRFLGALLPGGWPALMERNRQLALSGRRILCDALGVEAPCPDSMIATLAALPLPDGSPEPATSPLYTDPLQDDLLERYSIEVPIVPWPAPPRRLLRISAQLYNHEAQYERLAAALSELLH